MTVPFSQELSQVSHDAISARDPSQDDSSEGIPIRRSAEIVWPSRGPRFEITGLVKLAGEVGRLRDDLDRLCVVVAAQANTIAAQSKSINILTQVASEFKRVTDELTTAVNTLSSQGHSSNERANADDPAKT
jgi:hypothetical protein